MAESADAGMRDILRHCQTGRLVQAIADCVCKEKNPKTRQFAANYVKLVSSAPGVAPHPICVHAFCLQ